MMDRDFIYCIRSEKTVMSAKSVVGIYNYKPTTLSDRRKANPGLTNSVFNRKHNTRLSSTFKKMNFKIKDVLHNIIM